jgi:hypothetical protein
VLAQARRRPPAAAQLAPVSPFLFPSPSPEAAWQARLEASAQQARALPRAEPAAQDAVAVVRPALPDAAVAQRQEAAQDAAAVRGVAAARQEEVAARVAAQRAAAARAGVGLLREAPGAPGEELPSAVAWVVVWAFRRDPTPPWPAP